jgi:hypothetical protein
MLTSGLSLLVLTLGPCHAPNAWGALPGAARAGTRPDVVVAGGEAASAAEAAEQARRETGGRVLSVERRGAGWQVKVLTPAGEVRVVFIPAAGG